MWRGTLCGGAVPRRSHENEQHDAGPLWQGGRVLETRLKTARLHMRPLDDDDLTEEIGLDRDPEVLRYLYGRARTSQEVFESHCRRMELSARVDGLGYWVAFAADGEFVGLMMLPPGDEPGTAELGYRLHRKFWRQGFATEASRELLRHAFDDVGLDRVFARTMAVNAGSRGVMRAVGMRWVSTFFPHFDDPLPGSEQGEVEYEMTRADYLALSAGPPRSP